jgi:ribosomal-protein-alanine N-acetyltransferase
MRELLNMFNYRNPPPAVNLTTDRMTVRTVQPQDAYRLAEYYSENMDYLKPWEPKRDISYCYPAGWQARLKIIAELQAQGSARYFILLDRDASEVIGVANFSNIIRGDFHACYLGYSLAEKHQGKGLMYEALQAAIRYMFRQQNIHRIMANYMPHNQRSAGVLKRLGFEREGYAKNYLMINGQWQDHVLTALTQSDWKPTV